MNCHTYSLFSKFQINLETYSLDPIARYLDYEFFLFKVENCKTDLPLIGILKADSKILIPVKSSILINEVLYYFNDSFYYKNGRSFIKLTLCEERFIIDYNPNSEPFIVFYFTEICIRFFCALYNVVFLHASAFIYNGSTYLVNAFGGVGKTNLLLDALFKKGIFLADDLIAIDRDLNLYAYPKRINLLYYNFIYKPELLKVVKHTWCYFKLLMLINNLNKRTFIYRFIGWRLLAKLERKLNVKLDYRAITQEETPKYPLKIDNFYWMERSDFKTGFFEVSAQDYCNKMSLCLSLESSYYVDFDRVLPAFNETVEKLKEMQKELIESIAGKIKIKGVKKRTGDDQILLDILLNA